MKTTSILPENYKEAFKIDLQSNMKKAILVNVFSLVLFLGTVAIGLLIKPFEILEAFEWLILMVAYFVYMVLHEMVHGIFMKKYSDAHVNFGFTGLYAYAGSEETYFSKKNYITIALAPLVVWGIILAVACALTYGNAHIFWILFGIQAGNVSGAAGDLYVAWIISKQPDNILIQDTGVKMTTYLPK